MAKRKPWRRFKKKRLKDKHVRRVCLAVLAVEAGILKGQGQPGFPVVEVTKDREVIVYQLPEDWADKKAKGDRGEVPAKDQIYGIRIRLKDGVVDFYRREELRGDREKD